MSGSAGCDGFLLYHHTEADQLEDRKDLFGHGFFLVLAIAYLVARPDITGLGGVDLGGLALVVSALGVPYFGSGLVWVSMARRGKVDWVCVGAEAISSRRLFRRRTIPWSEVAAVDRPEPETWRTRSVFNDRADLFCFLVRTTSGRQLRIDSPSSAMTTAQLREAVVRAWEAGPMP